MEVYLHDYTDYRKAQRNRQCWANEKKKSCHQNQKSFENRAKKWLTAPQKPEKREDIMKDVEKAIMPGVSHWRSPNFHAFYEVGSSCPSILGDMLGDGIGCVGFTWIASPACTEIETIVVDWICKAISLPNEFLTEGIVEKVEG